MTPPMRYAAEGVAMAIIAGREYGSGSSRDWAAKGPALLGVRMVLAESYERIHRSNLVGMGILPLQFVAGESAVSLGLTGRERLTVSGLADGLTPRQTVTVTATADDGMERRFERDRPARWTDRRRVLPRRRDPADRPSAPAGGAGRPDSRSGRRRTRRSPRGGTGGFDAEERACVDPLTGGRPERDAAPETTARQPAPAMVGRLRCGASVDGSRTARSA